MLFVIHWQHLLNSPLNFDNFDYHSSAVVKFDLFFAKWLLPDVMIVHAVLHKHSCYETKVGDILTAKKFSKINVTLLLTYVFYS